MNEVNYHAPYIAAFGLTVDELTSVKLVIERENVLSMPSIAVTLHCCFACYYLYNISFPANFSTMLLFLEQYVYNLRPSQKLPVCVTELSLLAEGWPKLSQIWLPMMSNEISCSSVWLNLLLFSFL